MKIFYRGLVYGRSVMGVAAVLALAACGGGGGGSSPSASSGGSATVSGVAGTGAPMAGATVTISCQSGSASATTDANGAFTATFSAPPVAPCAIKAAAIDGAGAEIVQYSVLDTVSTSGTNTANINPATTVMAGEVVSGDPEKFFSDATTLTSITPSAVSLAIEHVKVIVGTSVDPLKGTYVADKTNELDQKFDQLKLEWNPDTASVTVTSKVTGTLVGTISTANFDSQKTAYQQQLADPTVVPSTAPSFAALDTQFGAQLTAALAGTDITALNNVIDSTYLDGGLTRTQLESDLWANARGVVLGKFSVLGCGNTGTVPVNTAYQNKVVCRVAAVATLPSGEKDTFEVRVIEKTSGTWMAWGDRRQHRVEVKAAALKSVRFDGGTVGAAYQSGLQIWIPVPRGSNPDVEAIPNTNVATAEVFIGTTRIAVLGTSGCSASDYLQVMLTAGCGGNLVPMADSNIQALIASFEANKTLPVVTVNLYDGTSQLIHSYDIKLAGLPLLQTDLADATKPYQANFATLSQASVTALSQLGASAQAMTLSWTAGVSVDNLSWMALSSTAQIGNDRDVAPDATSATFTPEALPNAVNYASVYLTSRGSEGRKYWTKYFGCNGGNCF